MQAMAEAGLRQGWMRREGPIKEIHHELSRGIYSAFAIPPLRHWIDAVSLARHCCAMNGQHISVVDPLEPALRTTRRILFEPFDLGKWFVIGFCAFLAMLGSGGGGGGGGFNRRNRGSVGPPEVRDYLLANLYWIVPAAVAVFLVGLAIWLVLVWLSSRGKFMFLHCVALNRAEIVLPWRQYSVEANSLFVFRACAGLLFIVPFLTALGLGFVLFLTMGGSPDGRLPGMAIGFVLLFVLVAVILGILSLIYRFLVEDVLTPVMYTRRLLAVPAAKVVLELVRAHVGTFVLYLLFRVVLVIVTIVIIVLVVLITCCVAGCLLMIPYIGTVLLLPILIFIRAYALHFLSQFGPGFNTFEVEAPAQFA